MCGLQDWNFHTANSNSAGSQTSLKTATGTYDGGIPVEQLDTSFTPLYASPVSDLSLHEFLARPVYVGSFNLPAVGVMVERYPFAMWASSSVIAKKLEQYAYINAVCHVRIDVTYNPHFYGLAYASLIRDGYAALGEQSVPRASGIPGVFQDFSLSNSVHLSARIGTNILATRLQGATAQPGGVDAALSLYYSALTTRRRDDDVATGTMVARLYVWCTDVALIAPTAYVAAGDVAPEDAAIVPEVPTAPTSRFKAAFNTALDLIDVAYPGMRAADVARKVGPALAGALGFSKPNSGPDLTQTRNYLFSNMANSIGRDSAVQLSLDPMAQVPVVNKFIDDDVGTDKLSLAFFASKPGLVGTITWATTDAAAAQLAVIPIAPTMCYTDGSFYYPTPIAGYGLNFDRWSGSIKVRLKASSTPYHRGKLVVAYFPNVTTATAVTMDVLTSTVEHEVIDISSGLDREFLIRWSQPEPYLTTDFYRWGDPISNVFCNGSLRVYVLDPLSATAPGASIDITVWFSGGDDLDFQVPTNSWNDYETRGDSVPAPFDEVLPTPVAPREFGAYKHDSRLAHQIFGERTASLRPLMHRYYPWQFIAAATGTATTTTMWVRSEYPVAPIVRTYDPSAGWTAGGVTIDFLLNPITFVCAGFAGYRGGFRHKVHMLPSAAGNVTSVVNLATGANYGTAYSMPKYQTTNQGVDTNWAAVWMTAAKFVAQDMSSGAVVGNGVGPFPLIADVEVRPNRGQMYSYFIDSSITTIPDVGFNVVSCTAVSQKTAFGVVATAAIAEDFTPVQFVGFPTFSTGGVPYIPGTAFPS